jgi:hypothetical protein
MMSSKSPAARIVFVVGSLVLALALVPAALAGKGGNGGGGSGGGGTTTGGSGGSISLVLLSSADGLAHFGHQVTFNVSTSSTAYPWVTLDCYVGGALVLQTSNGIFATSLNQTFTLGPTPLWSGGAADCTAWLQNWDSYSKRGSITNLASMSFHVYG